MADYGRPVQFGVFPTPNAAEREEILALADVADQRGLDLIGIQDHPYQRRYLDTWMLMPILLARTERVRVFPDVTSLPLRPPAVLAKAAASLDLLSDGRFELGLGAGAFWDAIGAMGGPRRTPGQAAAALGEAIEVIRAMWSDERSVRYHGDHYQLDGVKPGPAPAHDIGIWLGVTGPRLLELLGRTADGWVPSHSYIGPDKLPGMHERIDAGVTTAGRDPAEIQRIYNIFGTITAGPSRGSFDGPADQWIEELTGLVVDGGMDTFVFGPATDPLHQVQAFAEDVAPAVRAAVETHRRSR